MHGKMDGPSLEERHVMVAQPSQPWSDRLPWPAAVLVIALLLVTLWVAIIFTGRVLLGVA
jgi:hypothetical protein